MVPVARKPGRPRNPALEARRTREILAAAAVAFAEHGFASTEVQTIADTVGVGKGTIYRYFPTKEKLFLAAVERGLLDLSEKIDEILADEQMEPIRQLSAVIVAYLTFFAQRPEMAELFIQERAAFPHHHRPLYFSVKSEKDRCRHEAFHDRLKATGKLRPIPQEQFFAVIGDLLYGTILTNLLTGRVSEPERQARAILDLVFHGILKDSARKRPAGNKT